MTVYKIECEWDLGLSDVVYATHEVAWATLENMWLDSIEEQVEVTLEEAHGDGLVSIEEMEVIS